jgi:hypothetical protein
MIGICKNTFEPLSLAFAADAISTTSDGGSNPFPARPSTPGNWRQGYVGTHEKFYSRPL